MIECHQNQTVKQRRQYTVLSEAIGTVHIYLRLLAAGGMLSLMSGCAVSNGPTVMLGKLATHEFAFGGPSFDLPWPPPSNPWNMDHFTAGSSSGTGAAVAAGLILGGTGSETGGSIRGPAALCGIAGIKPTYGLSSRVGILPLAFTLDHAGPMAWTAADCALLLQGMVRPNSSASHAAY
jgi:Asp-tRNA(Asn)/Glu-tRNA(Gln) amidotransferase A subunit family amidase